MRAPVSSLVVVAMVALHAACGPVTPEPQEANGQTTVTVTKGDWDEAAPSTGGGPVGAPGAPKEKVLPAVALDPAPKVALAAPNPLVGGSAAEGPLPVPTTLAAAKGSLYVFGRTRAGWVVRVR